MNIDKGSPLARAIKFDYMGTIKICGVMHTLYMNDFLGIIIQMEENSPDKYVFISEPGQVRYYLSLDKLLGNHPIIKSKASNEYG